MKKYLSEHLVFFKDTFLTLVDPKGIFIGFGVIPSCFAVYFDKNEVSKIIISVFNFIPSLIHNFFERSLVLGIAEGVIGAFSVGLVLYSLIILFIFNGVLLVSDIIFMIISRKTGDDLKLYKAEFRMKERKKVEEREARRRERGF